MVDLLERLQSALVNRYSIEREIGRGGMATVFLAEDLKHHRQVAIKVLHPELAAAVGPDRFLREIDAVAGLTHPHVLPLFDSGEADSLLYYVMPYVEGESLRQRLNREKQLPVDEAIRITQEVAEALDHAHRHGLIHRDIKPGNILLEEGHAVVTDFGVARAISGEGAEKVTATGMAVGTPAYMSPEQAAGEEVDERSDLYALGCVLYEMLAGEPPLVGPTPQSTAAKRLTDQPTPLSALRDTVSEELGRVVERALERTPVDRYATAPEFAEALGIHSPKAVDVQPVRRSRRRVWVGFASVSILGGAALMAWFAVRPSSPTLPVDPDAIAVLPFRVTGTSEALRTAGGDIPELFWIKVTGDYGPRTVDPATVNRLWEAAGGSLDTPIDEEQALAIAEAVGAGRLVLGVVTGTEASTSLAATLLDVPSGRVRVRPTTVEGPLEEHLLLVDRLITQLFAKEYGEVAHRLPQLAAHRSEAVQAYLRGKKAWAQFEWDRAPQFFRQALETDSTFVLAALGAYQAGERDIGAARYAWEHQDELTGRDRAILRGLAGWRFGATRTMAERIAQFDSAGLSDWETDELFNLHVFGRLAEIPKWRERDRAGLERWAEVHPDDAYPARFRFSLAADEGDTSSMRRYADELARRALSPVAQVYAAGARLRLALTGDSTGARAAWERAAALVDTAPATRQCPEVFDIVILDGHGLEALDHFASTVLAERLDVLEYAWAGMRWARARGRYSDWVTFRDAYYAQLDSLDAAVLRVRDALFLGETEDSAVGAAADWLELVANGTIEAQLPPRDPTPEIRNLAISRCWSTLWQTAHREISGAKESVRYLREEVPLPYRWSVCSVLIEVLLAEQQGEDLRQAILRLDSTVRPVPMDSPGGGHGGTYSITRDGTHIVDNLILARKLAAVGDTAGALEAARRARPWNLFLWAYHGELYIDLLREEARLAAMAGDSVGAVDAYQRYFELRDFRPDHPPWAAQWDSMRVEYGTLTGVEVPRAQPSLP
jgi:hypothetical protein